MKSPLDSRRSNSIDGWLHPDFVPVANSLASMVRNYEGGAAVCVYHQGECVVDLWGGVRNPAGDAWEYGTMAPSFSTTKGVASTLVHIMVDRGLLDYDEPVATYWPEFAQAGKEKITLRHVLSHQSGLYHIRQMIDHADRMLDWEHMIEAIERFEPIHPPGERTGYHGLTYGFLTGEILKRVTGKSFSELVACELSEPLGLEGFYVGAPDEVHSQAASLMYSKAADLLRRTPSGPRPAWLTSLATGGSAFFHSTLGAAGFDFDFASILEALAPRGISGFEFDSSDSLRVSIPAANGLFTARSLAKMYAALAGGGEVGGVRILSEQTLAKATQLQVPTRKYAVIPFDMRWRLGYHGVITTRGVPSEAFGHFGFGGSGAWADPSRELSVALIVNCGIGTPFGDTRTARISGAALASVDAAARSGERSASRRVRRVVAAKSLMCEESVK